MSTIPTESDHAQKTLAESESDFTAEGAPPPAALPAAVGKARSKARTEEPAELPEPDRGGAVPPRH